jgi:hypothetical protein
VSSDPFHKNPRLILSILLITHFFKAKTVRKKVGIDERIVLRSFSLPALFRNLPFHVDSLFDILSMSG